VRPTAAKDGTSRLDQASKDGDNVAMGVSTEARTQGQNCGVPVRGTDVALGELEPALTRAVAQWWGEARVIGK
jgi:hypothetical protein